MKLDSMTLAWKIFREGNITFSSALKLAWKICKHGFIKLNKDIYSITSKIISKINMFFDYEKEGNTINFKDNNRNWKILSYELQHNL